MAFSKCLQINEAKALTGNDFKRLFEAALNKIPHKKTEFGKSKVALAISGGSDSMAMATLAAESLGAGRLTALIVDHHLQDVGVSENPAQVQKNLERLGIKSQILNLNFNDHISGKLSLLSGKIMMQTRESRYRALLNACKSEGIPLLLTGHNLEDDIVTMFYRISRMSGIDGLAGMKQVTTFPFSTPESDSYFILRPLLTVPKLRLVNTCIERGISWTNDTSNDDLSFRRNECLRSLIDLQKDNPNISTDALANVLQKFKGHRSYIHQKVSTVFSNSVILSKTVGDATLILNDDSIAKNNYLFNRVLTALVQFTTVSSYPPKTPSLNRIFKEVCEDYKDYQLLNSKSKYHAKFHQSPFASADDVSSAKRINFNQHTLAGASVYALSRSDTARRLSNFHQRSGKTLIPGPALLIQRESPSKKDLKILNEIVHDFKTDPSFLWDERIFLQVQPNLSANRQVSLTFKVKPLSPDLVKEFEKLTRNDFSARKNLYAYLGMTPGSHLHTIPVLQHIDSDFMAIPTLFCYSDKNLFSIKIYNSSIGVYASKFLCLP